MKNNCNKYLTLLFLLLPLIFLSCKSTDVPIPGQSTVILKNVYIEYEKLGDSYFSSEKYTEAISAYKKASEDKTLYWNCYYKIAKSYVFMSDWSNALPMYKELLSRDPENSSLKASIAYIYSMVGDYEAALSSYKEILSQQPKDEKYRENYLAIILSDKEIFENNKQDFDKSFQSFKKDYPENTNISIFEERYNKYTTEDKDQE